MKHTCIISSASDLPSPDLLFPPAAKKPPKKPHTQTLQPPYRKNSAYSQHNIPQKPVSRCLKARLSFPRPSALMQAQELFKTSALDTEHHALLRAPYPGEAAGVVQGERALGLGTAGTLSGGFTHVRIRAGTLPSGRSKGSPLSICHP